MKQDNTTPVHPELHFTSPTSLLPVSLLLLPGLVRVEIPIRCALRILGSLSRRLVLLTLLTLRPSSSTRTKSIGTIKCPLGLLCSCPSLRCLTDAALPDTHSPNACPNIFHRGISCIGLVRSLWRSTSSTLAYRRARRWSGALSKTHEALCATIQLLVLSILTRRQVSSILRMVVLVLVLLSVVLIPGLVIPS